MKYPECKTTCEPDLGLHNVGDKTICETDCRTCRCGARAIPHRGMALPCPLTTSGGHIRNGLVIPLTIAKEQAA